MTKAWETIATFVNSRICTMAGGCGSVAGARLSSARLSFCSLDIIGGLEHSQTTGLAAPIQEQWLSSWLAGHLSLKKEGNIS